MEYKKTGITAAFTLAFALFGCNGDSSHDNNSSNSSPLTTTIHHLKPQNSKDNYLFFGNTDHKSLDSLTNIKLFDPNTPATLLLQNGGAMMVRYPVITTAFNQYDNDTRHYSGLHTQAVSYISDNRAYSVSLNSENNPIQSANSNATGILPEGRSFRYKKINYLGTKEYLTAKDKLDNRLLITSDMNATDRALPFNNKTLLDLSYKMYGDSVNGYIVYDANSSTLQNCSTTMQECIDIIATDTEPIYLGDIGGSTQAVVIINNSGYILDKAENSLEELKGLNLPKRSGHATPYALVGKSIIMIENGNVSRYDIETKSYNSISSDSKAEKFHGFTDEWVFFGSDGLIEAARKDGSTPNAILLSETTPTQGHKYITNFATTDSYLYVTYWLDQDGQTHYKACIFKDEEDNRCIDDSYWSAIIPATDGELSFSSSYPYTPYAYIRIDETDNYGGGKLKAIDPSYPLEDGITLGVIENYNFQRFMQTSRYYDTLIESDGNIVLYAKDDATITENAFLVNLRVENSLLNLSNEKSAADVVIQGSEHCHGRYCMLCHSFAGGKIHEDNNGTKTALGYNIKFTLRDGTEKVARLGKGKGENFNLPISQIKQNFIPTIIEVNSSKNIGNTVNTYEHKANHINCNFCHGRRGNLHGGAMSAISLERTR